MGQLTKPLISSFASKVGIQGLGFLVTLFVIKEMGEVERGKYALVVSFIQLGGQVLNFGLHSANTFFGSQHRTSIDALFSHSIIAGFTSMIVTVILLFINNLVGYISFTLPDLIIISIGVPLTILSFMTSGLLLGLKKYIVLNTIDFGARCFGVLGFFLLILLDIKRYTVFLSLNLLSSAVTVFLSFAYLPQPKKFAIDFSFFKKTFFFGSKSYVSCLLSYLILKADILLIAHFLSDADVGKYSLAVTIVDVGLMIPAVFGQIYYSEWSTQKEENLRHLSFSKIFVTNFLVLIAYAILVYFAFPPFQRYFFKSQFQDVGSFLNILTVAGVFMGSNMITMNYLGSRGMPLMVIWIPLGGLILNIYLNYLLIPSMGIRGACFATLFSYFLVFLLGVLYARPFIVRR